MSHAPLDPAELRRRAEARLEGRSSTPSESDVRRLFHELEVHRIELELQNQALQDSQAETVAALRQVMGFNARLEAEVAARTADLVAAREAAEAASRAKSTFLSNMSHELRTPLNGVLGMIDLALEHEEEDKQIERLRKARLSAHHLLAVINDVLDISQIESGHVALAPVRFHLEDTLHELSDIVAPAITRKGLRFTTAAAAGLFGQTLLGDTVRLKQILVNLVGNAIKFTDDGAVSVRVQVEEEAPADLLLRFEVRDTGIGISEQERSRIFTAFHQADASITRRFGGSGLGLVISERLAEMMGGRVGVESQLGAGSLFWFTARLRKAEALHATPAVEVVTDEQRVARGFAGARVLVAEDDLINQEVIRARLDHVGLCVDLAADGAAAVTLASETDYALILMDLHMPVMGGLDATRAIRRIPGRERTPIIALSASVFAEDRRQCLEAGMDDHLGKPIASKVLFATLLRWFGGA